MIITLLLQKWFHSIVHCAVSIEETCSILKRREKSKQYFNSLNYIPIHMLLLFREKKYVFLMKIELQGRKWLPKTGWASRNAARRHCLATPYILPKTGWAIAHPALTPLTLKCKSCSGNLMISLYKSRPTFVAQFYYFIFSSCIFTAHIIHTLRCQLNKSTRLSF